MKSWDVCKLAEMIFAFGVVHTIAKACHAVGDDLGHAACEWLQFCRIGRYEKLNVICGCVYADIHAVSLDIFVLEVHKIILCD